MAIQLQPPPVNTPQNNPDGSLNSLWSRFFVKAQETVTQDTAPADGPYVTTTTNPSLTNEFSLGLLAAGYLKQTVAAGVAAPATTATIPATDLSGTLPDAVFPGTLPAISGQNVTNLNATNLASGTVPDGRFPAILPSASGVNLTALNASQLSSGTVPDARFPATLPAASGINLTALKGINVTHAVVTKVAADSPYTVLSSDETILVNAVAGAVTITLPAATSGRTLAIKKTDASANAVTLAGTVDGAASPTLTAQWQSRILQADGSNWMILSGFL